jgi:superfamily II DNA or RNA helicase
MLHGLRQRITASVAELVQERDGPGLVFVDQRQEAQDLAAELEQLLGIEVAWVTAEKSKAERAKLATRMRTGGLQLAVCTAAWSTGIDIPALRYVILAGRGKAPIGVLQSVGRALRLKADGSDFEVLNLSTDETARNAAQREQLLGAYGFRLGNEESFLDELKAQPPAEYTEQIDWAQTARNFVGPTWLWLTILILSLIGSAADMFL